MRRARKSILSLALALPVAAFGKAVTLGPTFPIAEPDAMAELQAKVASKDWQSWMRREPQDYGAFKSVSLPRAGRNDSRLFDPTYAIPTDIKDEHGKVLYPAGTRVNVYTKIKLPGRYIVIGASAEDFAWLDAVAKPTAADKILLAGGNALTVRQTTGRPVYVLDDRFVERFGLRAVPAIVQQDGVHLRVAEFALDQGPRKP